MSVRVTDKLFYFLPQTNKNHLSTSLPQFTKDTNSFEFRLRVKPDWDKLEDGIEYGEDLNNDEEYVPFAWFSFRCWTAWGPPVPVWDRLHAMGIEVEANYQDEGGMFEGAYRDGEDKCWQPEEEAV